MARETYVMRNGELVPKSEAAPLRGMHYISDIMEPTWHPASGRKFDSKKRFREETKAHGCREIGDQQFKPRVKPKILDKRERREDIRRTMHDLLTGKMEVPAEVKQAIWEARNGKRW